MDTNLPNEFVVNLVQAVTKAPFAVVSDEDKTKVVTHFLEFIPAYITEKYGEKEGLRAQALLNSQDETIASAFPNVDEYIKEAYTHFISLL